MWRGQNILLRNYSSTQVTWMNWCIVNQVQIIFHSSIFHFLSCPSRLQSTARGSYQPSRWISPWSLTIGLQIDDSTLGVCWGSWFPWESRLTVCQILKKSLTLTQSIELYTAENLSILLTPSRFGELRTEQSDSNSHRLSSLSASLTMSWYLYI